MIVYVCIESQFEEITVVCAFTNEDRAKAWVAERPTWDKTGFRTYDAVPLDPAATDRAETA